MNESPQAASLQLFAVTADGVRPLPIPPGAHTLHDLYDGMALGVYSTLRTFDHHKFLYLDAHIARTRRSMQMLGWTESLDETALRQALHQVCTAVPFPNVRVRFDVLAAPPRHLHTNSRLLIGLEPFYGVPPALYTAGVRVDFATGLRRENPLAKTAAFVQARQAHAAGALDAYERLLLDDQGYILECTSANFYGVRDGVVYTAETGVLEGVTRRIILEQVQALGIPLRLQPVHRSDVVTLAEAALSSSSRALIPIVQIGDQPVGNGRPGPISQQILQAYHAFVAAAVRPAVSSTD